jgi:hypothetical protein
VNFEDKNDFEYYQINYPDETKMGLSSRGIHANKPVNLQTDRGAVIGIGKLRSLGYEKFRMPWFSFIVMQRTKKEAGWEHGTFVSTCLNLQLDGYGSTAEEAYKEMIDRVMHYIETLFKDRDPDIGWDNIFSLGRMGQLDDLWDKFRLGEILLAKEGKMLL